jgi:lipopolysaccharide transport system permease protein
MEGSMTNQLDYIARVWKLRYFWFSMVKKDLDARYKKSFLGIGWSLLRPLAMTFIFCVVFGKLFNYPLEEYAPFLMVGMTTWQFLTECMIQGSFSFAQGGAYIRQQQVPLAIFPLRTVLGSGFHFLIALFVALGVSWYFKGQLDVVALLYLIPAMVLLFLLGWALAIVSGVLYTHFPDTTNLQEIGLQILFYITPIMYKPESILGRHRLTALIEFNPFTSLLAIVRTPVLEDTAPSMYHILFSVFVLVIVGSTALILLRKLERTLIFWI